MSTQGLGRTLTGGNDLTKNPSDGGYPEVRVLGLLRDAYRTARAALAGLPVTGWRWKRPPRDCPPWCAQDHRCTVRPVFGLGADGTGYQLPGPMSEHRSPSATWRRTWGGITATRVQRLQEAPRLELRVQVQLSGESANLALAQGVQVPLVVEQAITTVLAELEVAARMRADLIRQRAELEHPRPALPARRWV